MLVIKQHLTAKAEELSPSEWWNVWDVLRLEGTVQTRETRTARENLSKALGILFNNKRKSGPVGNAPGKASRSHDTATYSQRSRVFFLLFLAFWCKIVHLMLDTQLQMFSSFNFTIFHFFCQLHDFVARYSNHSQPLMHTSTNKDPWKELEEVHLQSEAYFTLHLCSARKHTSQFLFL